MEKGRVFTGARARFKLNGVNVGYARNVNMSEEIEYQPVEVIDNIRVAEHVAIAYRVTMSCSRFRIVKDSLKAQSWFPKTGKNSEEHLKNILSSGDMSATLEDSKSGAILATVTEVRVASHNWAVDARGIVGEDVQFVAIAIQDESEV